VRFEWDPEKSEWNQRVHGVSFAEACEVFTTEAPVLEVYDANHSETEDRFKTIGPIKRGLVLVVWTERADDLVRVISAWWATKTEEELYAEYVENLR
jgi:uncharacterized DUF497 family protein